MEKQFQLPPPPPISPINLPTIFTSILFIWFLRTSHIFLIHKKPAVIPILETMNWRGQIGTQQTPAEQTVELERSFWEVTIDVLFLSETWSTYCCSIVLKDFEVTALVVTYPADVLCCQWRRLPRTALYLAPVSSCWDSWWGNWP